MAAVAPARALLRPRVLLIAPHGSYRTAPFLAAAARRGVEVLIASEGRAALAPAEAQGLQLDLDDFDAARTRILAEAHRRPFHAVIGTDDATTELAAQVAGALGLPHNAPQATRVARRKDLARACLAQAGVPVPRHRCLDLRQPLAAQIEAIAFPCVLKPVAMAASRGVIRVDDRAQLLRAAARIERILAQDARGEERHLILVEEFVPGFEVAVEGLLSGGRLEVLAVFDKPDPLDGPYFEETYYVTPTRLSAAVQARIAATVTRACGAYGLVEGPVHAECRVNDRGVWVLEVAARTIGGLCARLLRFGTGWSLEELVLAHALGEPLALNRARTAAGVLMIPIPKAGILRRVEGVMAAQQVPFVEEVVLEIREGYELVPLPEGASYLGFIFAQAPTASQAEAALRSAHACLNIVVAPLWRGLATEAANR